MANEQGRAQNENQGHRPLNCSLKKCVQWRRRDKSLGKEHHWGWESRLCSADLHVRRIFKESRSLGLERQVGGKFHLKLNICARPIANKYREKDEKDFGKRVKSAWNRWEGSEWNQSRCLLYVACIGWICKHTVRMFAWYSTSRWLEVGDEVSVSCCERKTRKEGSSSGCVKPCVRTLTATEEVWYRLHFRELVP